MTRRCCCQVTGESVGGGGHDGGRFPLTTQKNHENQKKKKTPKNTQTSQKTPNSTKEPKLSRNTQILPQTPQNPPKSTHKKSGYTEGVDDVGFGGFQEADVGEELVVGGARSPVAGSGTGGVVFLGGLGGWEWGGRGSEKLRRGVEVGEK